MPDTVSPEGTRARATADEHPMRWADSPFRRRLEWVRRFRGLVSAERETFVKLIGEEVHKPEHEALTGDLMPLLAACKWHEHRADGVLREQRLRGRALWQLGQRHRVMRAPLGKVAIIATWNYPVQLLGVQLVQALVAGNTVVVKPSEHSARTQELLLRLAVEAGLPEGALKWTEATREAGAALIRDEAPDHVVFTGSTSVGRAIGAALGDRLIASTLELSGCDSAFVLDDADVELAARTIWHGVTMNGGQTCMAPRRALVDERVYVRFLRALAPLAASAPTRRLIAAAAAEEAHRLAIEAVEAGGRSLSGVCEPASGGAIRPLAVVDCPEETALVGGDHFGPVLAVVPVDGVDHAVRVHRRSAQHLTANIFTGSVSRARGLAPRLGASVVMINDSVLPSAHPGASLGGHGLSGWGVTRGEDGLLAMTRPVVVSRTSRRLRVPTDPPDEKVVRMLRRALEWLYPPKNLHRRSSGAGVFSKTGDAEGVHGGTAVGSGEEHEYAEDHRS